MFFYDLLIVLLIAVVLTAVFGGGFRRRTEWGELFTFFMLLFLLTWAFGGWFPAFGPVLLGVFWLPFLITGVLIVLLFTAFIDPPAPRTTGEAIEQERARRKSLVVIDVFFWLLLLGLLAVIIYRYLN